MYQPRSLEGPWVNQGDLTLDAQRMLDPGANRDLATLPASLEESVADSGDLVRLTQYLTGQVAHLRIDRYGEN